MTKASIAITAKFVLLFILATSLGAFSEEAPIININLTDIYNMNAPKYSGIQFIYHNIIPYNPQNAITVPPYPYIDGRVRDGKYKASLTAMDKYLNEIVSKYSGKTFTLVKFELQENGMPALIMACENGDTLYYASTYIASAEFINKSFFEAEKKKIGSKFFFKHGFYHKDNITAHINGYPTLVRSYAFKNTKNNKDVFFFPPMTEWTIKNVSIDTVHLGENFAHINMANALLSRIKYTVFNKIYGEYEAFLQDPQIQQNLMFNLDNRTGIYAMLQFEKENFFEEDIQNLNEWASKGDAGAKYILEKIEHPNKNPPNYSEKKSVSSTIIECAEQGYLYAVDEAISAGNVSIENKFKYVDKAKKRYGSSPIFDEFPEKIANQIPQIIRTQDLDEQIAIYEQMAKEYAFIQKKGIKTITKWGKTKDVKAELDDTKELISKLKEKKNSKERSNND